MLQGDLDFFVEVDYMTTMQDKWLQRYVLSNFEDDFIDRLPVHGTRVTMQQNIFQISNFDSLQHWSPLSYKELQYGISLERAKTFGTYYWLIGLAVIL